MGKFFTVKELTASSTARKYGIDNTPQDAEIIEHIEELIEFVDGVRAAWGGPLIVTSGYRCPQLNEKVGGAKTSAHLTGYALDIVPANNQKDKFFLFFKDYLKDKDFDELLLEKGSNGRIWIHFALKSIQGKQRKKIKTLEVK